MADLEGIRWNQDHRSADGNDGGKTWSPPKAVAETSDYSDHPLLITNGARAFLSWQTLREGFRLIPLEEFS